MLTLRSCKAVVAHLLTAAMVSQGTLHAIPDALASDTSCSRIDIRDSLSGELRDFLRFPKDQSGMGNCFAHATASLLSVKMGVPVSAVDLTIESFYETKSSLPKDTEKDGILDGGPGGDPQEVVRVLRGKSVCRESDMPSIDDFLKDQDNRTIEALKQLHETIEAMKSRPAADGQNERHCKLEINRFFPHLDEDGLYRILQETDQDAMIETLHRMADANCSGKRIPIPSDIQVKYLKRTAGVNKLVSAINAQLSRNAPLSFSYKEGTKITALAGHEMTILGREMRHGTCTYIVRNSWGYGCDGLPDEFQSDCNPVDGTYRLPIQVLRHEIGDVTYIK